MLLYLTLFTIVSSSYSPIAWSPNGQQIATIAPAGDGTLLFPDGWLWRKPEQRTGEYPETRTQIWVVDVSENAGFLIDETPGTFSAPGWAPKEPVLAYVNFTPDKDSTRTGSIDSISGKLDLVSKSATGERTILHSELGAWPRSLVESLPLQQVTWSPNGRYIAFPWLGRHAIKILNVETETVEADWPQASLAGWSPNGDWFAYLSDGPEEGFRLIRTGDWKLTPLVIPVTGAVQPILWEPAGDSVLLLRPPDANPQTRSDFAFNRRVQQFRCQFLRIHVPDLNSELVAHVQRAGQRDEGVVECSVSLDPKNSRWAFSILAKGVSPRLEIVPTETTSASLLQMQRMIVNESAFDNHVPIGALTFSNNGVLAYRFGIPNWGAPIAIDDAHHPKQFVAPTMGMRMRGLYSLVFALERITQRTHSSIRTNDGLDAVGRRVIRAEDFRDLGFNRPFPLDLFELPERQAARSIEIRESVNELTQDGLTLIEQAPPEQLTPILRRHLAEAALLLQYLREDYEAAILAADNIADASDGKLSEPDLLALDTVRLQCLVEVQKRDAARVEWTKLTKRLDALTRKKTGEPVNQSDADYQGNIINRVLLLEERLEHPRDKASNQVGPDSPPKPE